ncbi:MAG TPA: amidohydrolase family protein [Armatimonadota bacterium]|nr:amidohydrolase family protein [Armatimonadota bacterium]
MIIDCHVHLQGAGIQPELVEKASILGVERLCISSLGRVWSYEPTPKVFIEANNDVAEVMSEFPNLALGFCYLNPVYTDESLAEMKRCVEELGMVGVKLWVAAYADDPRVFPLVEKAIEYRIPVLQHAWHKATGNLPHESNPLHVADLARRYPEADIILAHIAGDWERGIEAVKDCPNILVDTSGSIIEMGMVERAVEELGARRVLFGSDAHGVDLSVAVAKILDAEIEDADRSLILGANMQALLERRRS